MTPNYAPFPSLGEDGVPELEHLLWVTNGPYGRLRFLLMLTAYLDESHDSRCEDFLVVAGYLAPAHAWNRLWKEWDSALIDEGISEFHAKDCEHGNREFKGIPRERRTEICHRFVDIIAARPELIAFGTAIELKAFEEVRGEIGRFFYLEPGGSASGDVTDPYLFAFQHTIRLMAKFELVAALPPQEKVAFVFDEHKLQGRAAALFLEIKHSRYGDFQHHLSTVAPADSKQVKPLQAADVLAYEVLRYGGDKAAGLAPRWQFEALKKQIGFVELFDKQNLLSALEDMEQIEVHRARDVVLKGNTYKGFEWLLNPKSSGESA